MKFLTDENVELPEYKTKLASGMDVSAIKILKVYRGNKEVEEENLEKIRKGFNERGYIMMRAFERILFGTGLKAYIPENMEIQVRSRSGITLKRGLSVLNSPGTVDADYNGEIGVILYNSTPFLNKVEKDERIAQLVCAEVKRPSVNKIDVIPAEQIEIEFRGENGFGSTGQK